jgi:hypothetical protein
MTDFEYSPAQVKYYGPKFLNEGTERPAHYVIGSSLAYVANGNLARLAAVFCQMVGAAGSTPGTDKWNLELLATQGKTNNAFIGSADSLYESGTSSHLNSLGYGAIICSDPTEWGKGNGNLYGRLGALSVDESALLVAAASPFDTGVKSVYAPSDWLTVIAMMKADPSKYSEVLDYKGFVEYEKVLAWNGTMEMSFFAASFIFLSWLFPKGSWMRKLYDLVNLKIREIDDLKQYDPADVIAWTIRIIAEDASDNFFGWNASDYFEEPFLRVFKEEVLPEGGIELDPLAVRLWQLMSSEMEVYADTRNKVPFWWAPGIDTAANIGNVSLAPVVTNTLVTTSDTGYFWHNIAITPRMLVRAFKYFSEQRRKIDKFKGTQIKVDTIAIGWKDLIETRATDKQSELLKHVIMNSLIMYHNVTAYFDMQHTNFKTLGDNDLFHMYVDFNEFILFDTQEGWNPEQVEDFIFGRLFWTSMMEEIISADGDKHDMVCITKEGWFGVEEVVNYQDGTGESKYDDAGSEYLYGFSSLVAPADDETYLDRTIPYSSPTTQITNLEYMGQKIFSGDSDSSYATLTYVGYGVNAFALVSKNIMNIENLMKWIRNKGFLNFGSKAAAPPPEVSDEEGVSDKEVAEVDEA